MNLTREKILEMEAGLELDMLVGQYIIGFEDYLKEFGKRPVVRDGRHGKNYFDMPNYSTDISAAWEVVEKLTGAKWMLHSLSQPLDSQSNLNGYECLFFERWKGTSRTARGTTAPLAICKAALLTVLEESL